MILGNPGSTDRYLTSWGVEMAINESNPTIVKIRAEKLRIMEEGMEASEKVRLQYASKHAGTSNYWKYFIGQTRGLKRLNVADKKKQIEEDFTHWIEASPEHMAAYGQALPLISGAYQTLGKYNLQRWYLTEAVMRGSEVPGYANRFKRLADLLADKNADKDAVNKEIERLKKGIDDHFKNFDAGIDQNMLANMMRMFYNDIAPEQQPALLREIGNQYKGNFDAWAADVFSKTNFADPSKVRALLNNPKAKTIARDPAFVLIRAFSELSEQLQKNTALANDNLQKGNRLFVAGLKAMQPGKVFYPNANFSLRLTYGTVQDYYPPMPSITIT